jgi:hypothetical protein
MDSFLSNIFPWMGHQQKQARAAAEAAAHIQAASTLVASPSSSSTTPSSSLPLLPISMEIDDLSAMDTSVCSLTTALSSPDMNNNRKRNRRFSTPTLICSNAGTPIHVITAAAVVTPCHSDTDDSDDSTVLRPAKMFRGTTHYKVPVVATIEISKGSTVEEGKNKICNDAQLPKVDIAATVIAKKSAAAAAKDKEEDRLRAKILLETPLDLLPDDVTTHALSFLNDASNRYAIQCTSKQFYQFSSTPTMMNQIAVGGDPVTGLNGIILETDTAETATQRLTPFAAAGNLEAIYMYVGRFLPRRFCLGNCAVLHLVFSHP